MFDLNHSIGLNSKFVDDGKAKENQLEDVFKRRQLFQTESNLQTKLLNHERSCSSSTCSGQVQLKL